MRTRIACLILIMSIALSSIKICSSSPSTKLFVDPMRSDVNEGESFTIQIKIIEAYDLFVLELRLGWASSILNATAWEEGDFLNQGGVRNTYSYFKVYNDKGYLMFSATLLGVGSGIDGSGTIARVTFTAKSAGETGLHLYGVGLADSFINPTSNFLTEDAYVNAAGPKFNVEPSSIIDPTLKSGTSFSVNITLTDVSEARGFEFRLQFNHTLLNVTDASVVPFLKEPVLSEWETDQDKGLVWFNVTSTASETVTKSGPVANVTFLVNTLGKTILELNVTKLDDKFANMGSPPFPHRPPVTNGYFDNIPPAEHDIEVSKLTAFPKTLKPGETVSLNATLKNLGSHNETVRVIAYYTASDVIEDRSNVVVLFAERKIVEFTWNTAGVPAGVYTLKVEAQIAEDEKLSNNVRTVGPVTIEEESTTNWYLYAGVGIAIVVVVVLVLYFVRFRKKS